MRAKWLKILLVSTLLAWDAGATAEGTALDAMESISGTTHYELVAENIDRPFQVLVQVITFHLLTFVGYLS